jgi:hypothetical protein
VLPPIVAGLVLSYAVLIPNDTAYGYIGVAFTILAVLAFAAISHSGIATGKAKATLLLAVFYCGTSLFLGFLVAFVFRVREAPWTMHVKDPGFGILVPLMTLGSLALIGGLVSLALLLSKPRQ